MPIVDQLRNGSISTNSTTASDAPPGPHDLAIFIDGSGQIVEVTAAAAAVYRGLRSPHPHDKLFPLVQAARVSVSERPRQASLIP
jgi:hypothetical protein